MKHMIVLDMSTIFYRAFYVHNLNDLEQWSNVAHMTCLNILNKIRKTHDPDKIVLVFDRDNWREDYLNSDKAISKHKYKGHRRKSMTPSQLETYKVFKQFGKDFQNIMIEATSLPCLYADKLEADDIIAGLCRVYGGEDNSTNNKLMGYKPVDGYKVTIISTDRDMIQLLRYSNVEIIDAKTGKQITLDNEGFDTVDYYLYQKSMTGDSGDNIKSAYPKYRKKKIREAFEDPYKHTNLMNCEWINENEETMIVGQLFNENRLLVDLAHQPDDIQQIMWDTIENGLSTKKRYDMFKFIKYTGRHNLVRVKEFLSSYEPLIDF